MENMIHHRVIFEMQGNSSTALSAETLCPLLLQSDAELSGTELEYICQTHNDKNFDLTLLTI